MSKFYDEFLESLGDDWGPSGALQRFSREELTKKALDCSPNCPCQGMFGNVSWV